MELLGGLKRVEAPANFDFGVRARIANGAPTQTSRLLPVLKLAAPLVLILVVAMIVIFYQRTPDLRTAKIGEPPSASSEVPSTVDREGASNKSEPISGPRAAEGPDVVSPTPERSQRPAIAYHSTPNRRVRRDVRVDRQPGGSLAPQALTPATTINAPGIPSGNQKNANSNGDNNTDVPVSEVLEMLGVSADSIDGGWKVISTKEGSLARKSGVKAGDVIEAIDGRELTRTTTFKGPSGGKTLRVRRDGKSLDVKLTN